MSTPLIDAPVYIVDDDAHVRLSLGFVLSTLGAKIRPFASGNDFLHALDDLEPGCTLLDIRMPGMDGIQVLKELATKECYWPVIMMTGHGEIQVAVYTMKLGAIDFLEKPFEEELLLRALAEASATLKRGAHSAETRREASRKLSALTPRERQVLEGVLTGLSNKGIANHLGLSVRTVEMHRANMLSRLSVSSIAEAVRIAAAAGVDPTGR